jgi:predicted enzyme related to lactoylglutathione lyase
LKALFISFPAANYEASKDFYENSIGLTPLRESIDGPHRFVNYDLGGSVLKIFEWKEEWHGSGHSGLFVETEALNETVERVRSRGGDAFDIVVHPWGGRCCTLKDPFGNLFDLIDSNMKGDA